MSKNKIALEEYSCAKQNVELVEEYYRKKLSNISQIFFSVFNKCHSATFEEVLNNTEYEWFIKLSHCSLKKDLTFKNIDRDSVVIALPPQSRFNSSHIRPREAQNIITIPQKHLSLSDRELASIIRKEIKKHNDFLQEQERKQASSRIAQLQKEMQEKQQEIEQLSQTVKEIRAEQAEKEKEAYNKITKTSKIKKENNND